MCGHSTLSRQFATCGQSENCGRLTNCRQSANCEQSATCGLPATCGLSVTCGHHRRFARRRNPEASGISGRSGYSTVFRHPTRFGHSTTFRHSTMFGQLTIFAHSTMFERGRSPERRGLSGQSRRSGVLARFENSGPREMFKHCRPFRLCAVFGAFTQSQYGSIMLPTLDRFSTVRKVRNLYNFHTL